ncbi:unnamed protein product [Ectocarpus sp. 6 AP-2014]
MHLTSLVLPTLCLGVAIGVTTAQTCDNGLAGVSNGDICCTLGCGTCGGAGCSTREGFTGDDCCTANIVANNVLCADSGAAPCIGNVDDEVPTETETETTGSSYLGCFSDLPDARIFTFEASAAAMTADVCLALCADSAYYGTQYSQECWCGAEGADYDANGEGVCDMPCGGDANEICGGFYTMSVYEIDVDDGETEETEETSYLGCFSDPADSRVFVENISSDAMTAEICSEACAGSAYYGTQYATQCWCGAEGADYDANGEGVCDMPCGGDANEICGGFYTMSVYENDVDDGETEETEDPSFLGCFSDPADSRVFVQDISSDAMTAEVCSEACAGSAYYGTQYSTECWCGDNADYDANGVGVCDMPCGGDAGEICGGFYAMSIYENDGDGGDNDGDGGDNDGDGGDDEDPSFLGCYSDPADNRVFVQEISSAGMTAEVCSEACAGSAYYGTHAGAATTLTTMPTAWASATCPVAATPTRSAEDPTPCRSTRTARTTGSPRSSRAPATPECRPALPAAKPTAALAEDRVAAPAAPAPLRAAPRSSSPPAPFAPTPGPPRASSKFLPSLLDVTPRYAHLARHVLPTNRATVSLLLHQSWRNSAQLVSIVSRPQKTG